LLKAHHEMGPMALGERFSFALERDDVRDIGFRDFYDSTIRKTAEK
jgi:hypothetical protein